ncbi:MAG TPA: PHP domain-containing protein [bacterium]|jgi:predicted metal-dependent phosphoesterase TrpH|nr:PHP domain-containing protein [bacterium]HOF79569.1 PHP domain-containing protein [bacterium]HOH85626.1 PHP domain-containing protein [bacterium]HOQ91458.1 PHP domain-containing protein [bacterium]HPL22482.1 PHP domain-containing protein [bacterium]
MLIDLQIHSIYSDGYLTPTAVAKFLAQQGVKVASLTDHNTLAGWPEFYQACQKLKIKPIPGIELYTRLNNQQINLLWYNLPIGDQQVAKLLLTSQRHWKVRLKQHLQKLVKAKLLVKDSHRVVEKFTNFIPTNGLLDALLLVPGNREIIVERLDDSRFREEEAIGLLFGNKKIGRLRLSCIDINRVIKLRRELGGQLVFCHPAKGRSIKRSLVHRLKNLGIDGIEVLSPHHSLGAIMYAQDLAKRYNLIITAGSDFHRFEEVSCGLKSAYDYWQADSQDLQRINEIIG